MLKLGAAVRYQGHWGKVIARTFGRERLYDLRKDAEMSDAIRWHEQG
jgi:hypothetical protein